MAFQFGSTIPGSSGAIDLGDWDMSIATAEYFNVAGMSMIIGERHGRDLKMKHWLHNAYVSLNAVETAFRGLEALIGKEKKLTDALGREFENCVLLPFKPEVGPIISPPLGWMYVLNLTWRQLKP